MGIIKRRLTNKAATATVTTPPHQGHKPHPTNLRVNGKSWYRIENHRQANSATVYLYDEIGLWGITASDFVSELSAIDAKHIDVHINSPGGDVFDGIAIYNALANHTATVTTYVDGLAASAASFIAQAGNPVLIARNAAMMIHDAEGFCIGNCAAMLEMADLLDAASNNIADIYAQKTGTIAQWRERMKATTWYHSGDDAVEAGLANSVYEPNANDDDDDEPGDTLAAKHKRHSAIANTASPVHHTDTSDATWDAGSQTKNLPTPLPLSDAKKVYAYYDDSRVENDELPKDACKLPHHEVSNDGTPGAANLAGCRNALSRLPQSDIPESEHDDIKAHLQAHLDDEESGEGESGSDKVDDSVSPFVLSPDMLVSAFSAARAEMNAPPFDVEQFKLTMSTLANDVPAIKDNEPAMPVLPPMPEPDTTVRCDCGRAIDHNMDNRADYVIDPATLRQIMADAANNSPAMPDDTTVSTSTESPVLMAIDRASFEQAIRKGLW